MAKVCAIAVTFNPDLRKLERMLLALAPQVGRVVVVDNGSANVGEVAVLVASTSGARLLSLGRNLGIGAALNRGVDEARRELVDAVLLMDQDSVPSSTMVADLERGLEAASKGNVRGVAAIGPRFRDGVSGNLSRHVVFSRWRVGRVDCFSAEEPVAVDFLITSGTLIPVNALAAVGPFDEGLFIDHVDTEWVLRAGAKGFQTFGDCVAIMEHDLGEYRKRVWALRWREVPMHKPFRYYYIFRNSLWLRRQPHASSAWRRADATRLVQIFVFMLVFHPNRWTVFKMMLNGARDSLRGRMGSMGEAV